MVTRLSFFSPKITFSPLIVSLHKFHWCMDLFKSSITRALICFLLALCINNLNGQSITSHIHIDQFGYLPNSDKVAVISNPISGYNSGDSYTPGTTLSLIDSISGITVFSGSSMPWNSGATHSQSGDAGWWFDFSSVTAPGTYFVFDPTNNTKSYNFKIADDVYFDVLKASFKMFYYNRCNLPKESPYAEANWTDGNNFHDALQDSFCRYVFDPNNSSLERDLSGGWFDAGDYNKYVTFAVRPVHQLLYAYQESSDLFLDNWNIPESGNGVSDLIDELKWELDWFLKMINSDGSVILKMGSINYQNSNSPPSNNYAQRFYGPTCTSASIAMAGMLAHAALVLESIPSLTSYASILESNAASCFAYALPFLNNNQLETACDDGTINAGDADWDVASQRQRAVLAALYLWELTSVNAYHDYVKNNINDVNFISGNWLGNGSNEELEALLHYSSLSGADQTVITELNNSILPHITGDWNGFFGMNNDDLYRSFMPDWAYHWGSNLPKSDFALLNHIIKKYNLNPSGNASYNQKTQEHVHYFHGINPQNIVYLSNMYALGGDHCANEIYHAWFADGSDYDHAINSLYGPAPGFVVGGANKDFTVTSISPPSGQPIQKSYLDFNTGYPDNSWEITEPAIYYQAAYLRLLALHSVDLCSTVKSMYVDISASGNNDGKSWNNAYPSIESALSDACISYIDTLRIAEGIYIPQTNDRDFVYPINRNLTIIGGYSAGGAISDPLLYPTILSGNISNSSIDSDNLYHAIYLPNPLLQINIENVTISHGYADGLLENGKGAGIYSKSNLSLKNVIVTNNSALSGNEGLHIENTSLLDLKGAVNIINNTKL